MGLGDLLGGACPAGAGVAGSGHLLMDWSTVGCTFAMHQTRVMTELLLAEEIFPLTHNEESGKGSGTLALDNGLAGAH